MELHFFFVSLNNSFKGKGLNIVTQLPNQPFPPILIAFIVFSSISYLFSCYWDIVRDWGLLRCHARHRFLRDELLYRP
jgi:hypothetical protein